MISNKTGIPRSTTGYYVRKFNKGLKKRGLTLEERLDNRTFGTPKPSENNSRTENKDIFDFDSPITKFLVRNKILDQITDFFRSGKYDQLYYYLESLKLLREITKILQFTPEENNEWQKLLNPFKGNQNVASKESSSFQNAYTGSSFQNRSEPERRLSLKNFGKELRKQKI